MTQIYNTTHSIRKAAVRRFRVLVTAVALLCSLTAFGQQQSISLTWQAEAGVEKTITIRASEGTNNVIVDWGNGNVDAYNGQGENYINNVLLKHI